MYIIYILSYCLRNYFSPASAVAACLLDHDYIIQTTESKDVDEETIFEKSIEKIDDETLDPSYFIDSLDNLDSDVDNVSMVSIDLDPVMYSTNIHNNVTDETMSQSQKRKLYKKT